MTNKSTHRRCQIVIDSHPLNYAGAMGELRIRGHIIGNRIFNGVGGKERAMLWEEYHEIQRLLTEWSKTITPEKGNIH